MIEWFIHGIAMCFRAEMRVMFWLGISSGLPMLFTLSTLSYWLATYEISKVQIGLMSLTGLPYAFKFLWASILDRYSLFETARIGRRKSWLLCFQFTLLLTFLILSQLNPSTDLIPTIIVLMILAFSAANQDIIIDAYRVDAYTVDQKPTAILMYQFGYRIALFIAGASVLILSDRYAWSVIFIGIAVLMALLMLYSLTIHEPSYVDSRSFSTLREHLEAIFIAPLREFIQRKYSLLFLWLILLLKLPEAMSGVMVMPFYREMQYSGLQVGISTSVYGLIIGTLGAVIGAWFTRVFGLYMALLCSSIGVGLSNLMYLKVFYAPNLWSLILAVGIENIMNGFSAISLLMLLSLLCHQQYSAMQYALFSSVASMGVRLFAPISGGLAETLDWNVFFIVTASLCLPSFLILLMIRAAVKQLDVSLNPATSLKQVVGYLDVSK